MATDIQKWEAAQKGLSEFSKIDPIYKDNPQLANSDYQLYKGASRDSFSITPPKGAGWKAAGNAASGMAGLSDLPNKSFGGAEFVGLSSIGKGVGDLIMAFKTGGGAGLITAGLGKVVEQATEVLRQETQLRNEINSKMGVTGMLGDDIRDSIMTSASYGQRFGFSIKDAASAFTNLNGETGRFATFSDTILQKGFATAGAFLPTLGDLGTTFAQFEKIGVGFSDTLSQLNDIGKQSMVIGLNGQQTVKDVRDNIELINRYNFKNGTEGLAQMSRIAKTFRTDMKDAFTVAESVMDPEGAIEMSARLQALGGSIGEFNDVYKLMYDSVNNPEGIQKALISMSSGLAAYNAEAGKFEMTSVGIRMAREQAKITGQSYESITRGAIAANEKIRGLQQLASTGLNIDGPQKDFLLNLARMEGGEMKITIPPDLKSKFLDLGGSIKTELEETGMISFRNMNKEAFARFQAYQDQFKDAFPEDIARGQYTLMQNISNDVSAMASYLRARAVKGAGGALSGLGLEGGIQYAAKYLDMNVRNLTREAKSNKGFSRDVKSTVQEALNFLSFGLVDKAKAKFNEADIKLTKELEAKRAEDNKKQNGTTNQINTRSVVEQTLGQSPVASVTNNSADYGTRNVVVSFRPSDNMSNELQRAAMKNPDLYRNITGTRSRYAYDNDEAMLA